METVYFNGQPCHTSGTVPAVGQTAPDFVLTGADLSPVKLENYKGKKVVLNIFPSLDTAVCARSVRKFNEDASQLDDTVVLCISMDLPFAMARFCTLEGLKDVTPASAFRSPEFSKEYGVQLVDGPLKGLLTRVVLIVDKDGKIIFRDVVEEITHDPDYDGAMRVLTGKF
ncbi:MAG: thiol peroxidase [Paramuribaculum sp.]|nr:thiol peroxidase [Paramuribaculum sp.]